ncbi:uncharacterized protein [Magallana gigas]|uniref:uncharacterized protein isoform X4 n=1 Tax=Magallana gigas TaxID=29159 RepID=UPI003342B458
MEEFDLDKRIFKGLEGLDMLKFAIINLVSCNGTKSISFSEVSCDYEVLRDKTDRRTCFFPFQLIFNYGVSFLESLEKASSDDIKNMEPHMKKAVLRLNAFYKSIEYNQTCLKKVFDMKLKGEEMAATETDISITLAEHLLGKLAPGESYKIDNKAREKKSCRCGCKVTPVFDGTGIGHEQVWHGFIDIVFSSHLGIHSMANAVLDIEENISKKRRVDEQDAWLNTCESQNRRNPECWPGSRGVNCAEDCAKGFYGRLCKKMCECYPCDKVNGCQNIIPWLNTCESQNPVNPGTCSNVSNGEPLVCCPNYRIVGTSCEECWPGFRGVNCAEDCAKGFYGRLCREKCLCDPCDKVKGCQNITLFCILCLSVFCIFRLSASATSNVLTEKDVQNDKDLSEKLPHSLSQKTSSVDEAVSNNTDSDAHCNDVCQRKDCFPDMPK